MYSFISSALLLIKSPLHAFITILLSQFISKISAADSLPLIFLMRFICLYDTKRDMQVYAHPLNLSMTFINHSTTGNKIINPLGYNNK